MSRVRRGELASVGEIMLVASVPRQTVNRWLREDRVDLKAMRLRQVARMHAVEAEYLDTLSGSPRPTKRQRWLETQKAVRRFNDANAKEPGSARAGSGSTSEVE